MELTCATAMGQLLIIHKILIAIGTFTTPQAGPSSFQEYAENPGHLNAGGVYTLVPPSNPSTPEAHTQHLKSTPDTATKLIRALHIAIDHQREDVSTLRRELGQSSTEIADLKIALDPGSKLPGTTYRREWKLWQWINDLSIAQREERRLKGLGEFFGKSSSTEGDRGVEDARLPEGFEWENFGHGPEPLGAGKGGGIHTEQSSSEVKEATGTASLQKDELGNILSMAEKNVRTLKEGVAEMVALVQACKLRATGIQEPQKREM